MALSLSTQARQNIVGSLRGTMKVSANNSAGSLIFVMVSDTVAIPNGTTQTMFSYINQVLNFSGNDGAGSGNRANVLGLAYSSKASLPTDSFTDGDTVNLTGPWNFTALQTGTVGSILILKRIEYISSSSGNSDPIIAPSGTTLVTTTSNSAVNLVGISESITAPMYNAYGGTTYGVPDAVVTPAGRGAMYMDNGALVLSNLSNSSTVYANFAGCTDSVGLIGSGAICELNSDTLTAGTSYVFNSFCLRADQI